ncbi:hypothetical protein SAMD00019534_081010 [Acytostelium subglobosum LB1]|uniref:hypothetical protein n=1 Tax=Acytostelium subglobosum LB1 TaxID=1410327 RepID=UPI00064485D1|nr:hypothetical protein SAMD00019534_081010 [Acytostelium subglobosum LB1]GAM24926.1 hypothetical protein SAMD00019534_081010 [Acytostelium subglobosum LB1]|eukprot:XP_012752015.1 hypothetical protein SAMD00019534_081010 [Acytostelium subglobosum LB1]
MSHNQQHNGGGHQQPQAQPELVARKCFHCNGTGSKACFHCTGTGRAKFTKHQCGICRGAGKDDCFHCKGTGTQYYDPNAKCCTIL